jgi:hypothetical protein
LFGGPLDRVVVDLAPLRMLDSSSAAAAAAALAASTPGLRQVGHGERSVLDVPFNMLPLLMPGACVCPMGRLTRPTMTLTVGRAGQWFR